MKPGDPHPWAVRTARRVVAGCGAVGHTGQHDGYVSWAGCLPEDGAVVVVLTDQVFDDIGAMAGPLVDAVRSSLTA